MLKALTFTEIILILVSFSFFFFFFFKVDPSGEIVEFEEGGCPWKEHLFELEENLDVEAPIKFVIYTDQNNKWRVQVTWFLMIVV